MTTDVVKYKKNIKDSDGNLIETIEGEVSYDFPSTIQEAIEAHGEDVVLSIYNAALEIKIQNICRAADSQAEAQTTASAFIPGTSRRSSTGLSKKSIFDAIAKMPDAVKAELLEKLKMYQ